MPLDLDPPFVDLTFMSPLSQQRAGELTAFLAETPSGTVLDLGCGWAELLLQVLARAPVLRGLGADLDGPAIAHGRSLAVERGLADRVDLVEGDAEAAAPDEAEAVICIGASQIWGADVAENQPLDYASALAALRRRVPRGGRVLYGEGVWSVEPTQAAIAPLAGRSDEFVTLAELVELAVEHGFMPVAVHEGNLDEWDVFESGYSARYVRWLAVHAVDHPDAASVRESARRQREGYLAGYRGVLGLAYLCLVAV